jgi:hypothetical protein
VRKGQYKLHMWTSGGGRPEVRRKDWPPASVKVRTGYPDWYVIHKQRSALTLRCCNGFFVFVTRICLNLVLLGHEQDAWAAPDELDARTYVSTTNQSGTDPSGVLL